MVQATVISHTSTVSSTILAMMNYEKSTPVHYIDEFLELPTLHRCRVESLPPDVLAIVACQMINVSAIPVELEQ